MARIGICLASARGIARIARVAARPSITGIITSMRIASNVPGDAASKQSTAFFPFFTIVTWAPASVRSVSAISAFNSLSSAKSSFKPRISPDGAASLTGNSSGGGAISNGISTTNVVPMPTSLVTSMFPCICSISPLTIVMPSPVPW